MTRETASKKIRGFPLSRQSVAKEDIENRAYVFIETVPVFEMEDGYFQITVNYRIKLDDGYIYGKALNVDEFAKMHCAADCGKVFSITYLEKSRIIIEIEEKDS